MTRSLPPWAEQDHVGPLLEQRRNLLRQLHLVTVVTVGLVRRTHALDRRVSDEHDVQSLGHELVHEDEEAAELFLERGVPLAVTIILDALLAGPGQHVLDERAFAPISGVDDDSGEALGVGNQRADGSFAVAPVAHEVTLAVDFLRPVFVVDDDGSGDLRC
jgi:hypothetical protein